MLAPQGLFKLLLLQSSTKFAILQGVNSVCLRGGCGVVRNQDDPAALFMLASQNLKDNLTILRIEIPGRFVREDQGRDRESAPARLLRAASLRLRASSRAEIKAAQDPGVSQAHRDPVSDFSDCKALKAGCFLGKTSLGSSCSFER